MNETKVRKRFTATERARILADYQASGMTQRVFARQSGVSLAALGKWLKKARSQESAAHRSVSFVELPAVTVPPSSVGYKVQLAGRAALEVPRGFSAAEVRELLGLVREL